MKKFIIAGFLVTGIAAFNSSSAQEVNNPSCSLYRLQNSTWYQAKYQRTDNKQRHHRKALHKKPSTAVEGYISFNNPLLELVLCLSFINL